MFPVGTQELMIVMVIVLVLFGGSRLPAMGKGMGQALRNFKKGISVVEETDTVTKKSDEEKKQEGGDTSSL
ncbi:MAG TPA: twin-arginine translocase TatA/TatE family subunit [Nitrospiraceae bacterium]|nr:twin-arginine translocase TatA/TatE family subunit [Nitrospiraceae bacterium]